MFPSRLKIYQPRNSLAFLICFEISIQKVFGTEVLHEKVIFYHRILQRTADLIINWTMFSIAKNILLTQNLKLTVKIKYSLNNLEWTYGCHCLVQVLHPLLDFRRFGIRKRQSDHDDASAEVVAKVDAFAHLPANDAEQNRAILKHILGIQF